MAAPNVWQDTKGRPGQTAGPDKRHGRTRREGRDHGGSRQQPRQGARRSAGQHRKGVRQGLDHALGDKTAQLSRGSRPGRSRSTSPWAARPAARPDHRCSARSRAARRRSPCTPSPTPRRIGGVAAFIDAEHALDPSWCKRLGVNIESLLVSQPGSAEEALQIAEMLVLSNAVDIIVIDSVAALVPRAEIEGEIGDSSRRPAGPPDEPGPAQADRRGLAVEVRADLHQPDPREDRRDVRQPRDDARRPGPEVLQLVPDRRPPDRAGQGGRGDRRLAGARSRSSRTRSPRRSASASST